MEESSRDFEIDYTKTASKLNHIEIEKFKKKILNTNLSNLEKLRNYCIIFTFYRRQRELSKCIEMHQQFKSTFENTFSYNHLYSIAIKQSGRVRDIKQCITFSKKALEKNPYHSGALHNLSEALYQLSENEGFKSDAGKQLLEEGLEYLDEAISIEDKYAKFYSTRSKFLSAQGSYKQAKNSIIKAIEMEDSKSSDYALRISDYLAIKTQVDLRQGLQESISEAQTIINDAVQSSKRSNFEILSFFVATISFVIAGIKIAVAYEAKDAATLMFIISAAFTLAIAAFSLMHADKNKFLNFILIFGVSLIMLFLGFIIRHFWI